MDELSIHIALNNGDCTTLYVFARRKNILFKSEDAKEYENLLFNYKKVVCMILSLIRIATIYKKIEIF